MSEPPTTKWPNVSITRPAYPSTSTSRVALTLRASRKRVITSRIEGNEAKSRGRTTNIAVIRISSAPVMFMAMSRSRTIGGSGMTSITTIITTPTGTPSLVSCFTTTTPLLGGCAVRGTVDAVLASRSLSAHRGRT